MNDTEQKLFNATLAKGLSYYLELRSRSLTVSLGVSYEDERRIANHNSAIGFDISTHSRTVVLDLIRQCGGSRKVIAAWLIGQAKNHDDIRTARQALDIFAMFKSANMPRISFLSAALKEAVELLDESDVWDMKEPTK